MRHTLFLSTALAMLCLAAPAGWAQQADEESDTDTLELEQIIVTGVFRRTALEDAPVAVTAVSRSEIDQAAPISAADVLKSVPGVFVNSGFGEIRNIVYSRGVSAGSNEAATGYFYVSLQEDGLPVTSVTFSNYGPDYFARPDLMLSRVEALRGGTATITGPNAPGGIFNYISRNGRDDPGGEVAVKLGLEGDGRNPYYRGDFYYGGEIGGQDTLFFSLSGFYRHSDGARDPGYATNDGGQIRGNLIYDYGDGALTASAKYLRDSNGFFFMLPARNFDDPTFAPGIRATDSIMPPAAPHSWINPQGGRSDWDGSRLVESEQISVGLNWEHTFANGISLANQVKAQSNTTDWNTGAVIFPLPVNDPFVYILSNSFGLPGTFTFRDRQTGDVVARVVSATGFDHTVVDSDLPNPGIVENGVLTQLAFDPIYEVDEIINQFKVSKAWGRHAVTAGAFFAYADIYRRFDGGGIGISGIEHRPQLFDIELELADGTMLDVTSPEGFAALGDTISAGNETDGSQEQYSVFFGHVWDITDRVALDWGVRYENIAYEATNRVGGPPPDFGDPTVGGEDGDPSTLYDNFPNVQGPPISARRTYDYLSFSVSVAFEITDQLQSYARYSNGQKAPDFQTVVDLDTQAEADNLFVEPQEIQQIEIGLKYSGERLSLALFPFWSELDNVTSGQLFSDDQGISYSPPPTAGRLTTSGVEIEADYQFNDALSLRVAFTIQQSDSEGFGFWVAGEPTRADDELVEIPDGDADNIPDLLGRATLSYAPNDWLSTFLTWTYLGDRPANRYNTFDLPAFSIFDAGVAVQVTDRIAIRADIKNLLNEGTGVLSWAPSGGFLSSLDRQALTPDDLAADPNQTFSIVTAQPRSFFLTAAYRF